MTKLVKPHGADTLKPLLLEGEALREEKAMAATLPKVPISSREAGDLIMSGAFGARRRSLAVNCCMERD